MVNKRLIYAFLRLGIPLPGILNSSARAAGIQTSHVKNTGHGRCNAKGRFSLVR